MSIFRQVGISVPPFLLAGTEILFLLLFFSRASLALELRIPEVQGHAGQSVGVAVQVDKVDNLAGIRLVVEYDPKLLTFAGMSKSEQTAPLMHIVNDKNPGRLVIVMAGAVGISGENMEILRLLFTAGEAVAEKLETPVTIVESELMSDKLEQLPHAVKAGRILFQAGDPKNTNPTPEGTPRQKDRK